MTISFPSLHPAQKRSATRLLLLVTLTVAAGLLFPAPTAQADYDEFLYCQSQCFNAYNQRIDDCIEEHQGNPVRMEACIESAEAKYHLCYSLCELVYGGPIPL